MPPLKPLDAPALAPPASPRTRATNHHKGGGAWKVAYADFVTALMALFIVLWMMTSTQKVKESVSGYFRDPRGYTRKLGAGPLSAGEGLSLNRHTVQDLEKQIEVALQQMPEFGAFRDQVKLSVTGEGLRIDLLETEEGMFFVSGSPSPTGAGERLLGVLGTELGKMSNPVVIEGHTDARQFRNSGPYGNWELSVDRANAARRLLRARGVRPDQIVEVRGFADQKALNPTDPNDPRNRRVSVVVKFKVE